MIQPNIYRILSKVNHVIYTLDTICEQNIMILAQVVLQLFCRQGSIGLQRLSRKREIIKPNIDKILPKVNQVIYSLDTICEPNIMILAQVSPDILLTRFHRYTIHKSKKGDISVK